MAGGVGITVWQLDVCGCLITSGTALQSPALGPGNIGGWDMGSAENLVVVVRLFLKQMIVTICSILCTSLLVCMRACLSELY